MHNGTASTKSGGISPLFFSHIPSVYLDVFSWNSVLVDEIDMLFGLLSRPGFVFAHRYKLQTCVLPLNVTWFMDALFIAGPSILGKHS